MLRHLNILLLALVTLGLVNAANIPHKRGSTGALHKRANVIQQTVNTVWTYRVCVQGIDALSSYTFSSSAMTPELCVTTCDSRTPGTGFAALENGNTCVCGPGGQVYGLSDTACQAVACPGRAGTACGGSNAAIVYKTDPVA
jgi:hypothetical protein